DRDAELSVSTAPPAMVKDMQTDGQVQDTATNIEPNVIAKRPRPHQRSARMIRPILSTRESCIVNSSARFRLYFGLRSAERLITSSERVKWCGLCYSAAKSEPTTAAKGSVYVTCIR